MSRLLEFHQADEATIVSRILLQVHKAVDQNFPHVKQTSRRFAKTLFSENDEPTHNKPLPTGDSLPVMPLTPPPPPSREWDRQAFQEEPLPVSLPPMMLEMPARRVTGQAAPTQNAVSRPASGPNAREGRDGHVGNSGSTPRHEGTRESSRPFPLSAASALEPKTEEPEELKPKKKPQESEGRAFTATHLSDAFGLERYQQRRNTRLRFLVALLILALLYLIFEHREMVTATLMNWVKDHG